jgi:hypothetical protein
MPIYDVFVRCAHCGDEHPALLRIYLVEVLDRKKSIAEVFGGRIAPAQVSALRSHTALCLKTGKRFNLEEGDKVFLVRSELGASL